MFEIEAIKAKHGDCLLLRWGSDDAPCLAVIDGGPDLIYSNALKPRLLQIAKGKPLTIDLMMLSHIDDDHIKGMLDMLEEIDSGDLNANVELAWFNSLEGLLDGDLPSNPATVTASVRGVFNSRPQPGSETDWEEMVLASVPQGQNLTNALEAMGLMETLNHPYPGLIMRGLAPKNATICGLKLTPVAPDRKAVEALRKVWKEKRRDDKDPATAAYKDRSPYNLSSIVVIAEYGERSMLLTGDALGRHILEGLEEINWPKQDGRWHFDLIKLPHHGSQNNVTQGFFEKVTADRYVVSGDQGKFHNPNENAMKWLYDARAGDDYRIWCTYPLASMRAQFGDKLIEPARGELGVRVALPEKV